MENVEELNKPSYRILSLACVGALCNGLFLNVRGPCLNDLAEYASIPDSYMSYFFLTSGIGGVAAALPTGWLLDRSRVRAPQVFAIGLLIRAVSVGVLPWAGTSVVGLALLGLVQGCTLPLVGIPLRCLVVWSCKGATPYLNLVMASFGVGSIAAPLIYDGLSGAYGGSSALKYTFWGMAVLCVLVSLPGVFMRINPPGINNPPTMQQGDEGDATEETAVEETAVQRTPHGKTDDASGAGGGARRSEMTLLLVFNIYLALSVGVEGAIGSWISTFVSSGPEKQTGFDRGTVINAGLWGVFTISRLVLVPVSARLHQRHTLLAAHVLMVAGLGLGVVWSLLHAGSSPLWLLWTITVLFGTGIAAIFPNGMGYARRVLPDLTGIAQACFELSANAGNGLVPALAGWLSSTNLGKSSFLWTPLVGVIMMQLLLLLLNRLAQSFIDAQDHVVKSTRVGLGAPLLGSEFPLDLKNSD